MAASDPTAPPSGPPRLAPGWYPDPVRDGRAERWWSGEGWTGHTRPVSMPSVLSAPSGRTAPRDRPRNRLAWSSLGFGLLSLFFAVFLLFHTGWVGVSWLGVAAVVQGIRALRRRSDGASAAPAVVGISVGGLATVVMLATLLPWTPSTTGGWVQADATSGGGIPAEGPLDAVAQQPIPDDALSRYTAVKVRSVTASAAGCGVFSIDPEVMPRDSRPRTAKRIRQDDLGLQLQHMIDPIRADVLTSKAWPAAMDVDPDTGVVFLPAPACTRLGVRPEGAELRFGSSTDHGQIALALWDPRNEVGTIWRSVDDTVYQL